MSVVINTSPTGLPSVHDNMWHVITSDNSGTTDFKYVVDVYVDGVQKIRNKLFPEPSNGKCYFDAGPIVRNELEYNWFEPTNTGVVVSEPGLDGKVGIVYQLRVGEEVSGVTTLNMASGDVSGYNWAPPLFKRRVITLADKVDKWLTNRPLICKAELAENLFIGFYTTPGQALSLRCDKFDASNNQIGSTLTGSSTPYGSGFIQMNIGTTALSATLSTTFDAGVKYYEVYFNNGFINYDKFRVYITCNPKYTCIPIHFLNRWGMWDTQRFDLASRLMMKVDRKGFSKRDYEFNDNSVDYISSSNRYIEGKIDYSNKANWTYKLTADGMTDSEYEWMADLIHSPQILLENDGYFYPVTMKENDFEYRKFVNDKLKALEIEFELNSERYTQLR